MKKLKVLILDDSSVMRKIVKRALRQAGLDIAEVLEASNGAEAFAEVQQGSLDLILGGINMPVMGRPGVSEECRRSCKGCSGDHDHHGRQRRPRG